MAEDNIKSPGCAPGPDASWTKLADGDAEATSRILDGLRDGIILHTKEGVVMRINRSMAVILGTKPADAAGRRIEELFGEDIRLFCVDPKAGTAAEAGRRTLALNGREYEVDCTELTLGKEGGPAEITVLHDVTEKRNLEEHRSHILSMVSHDVRAPLTTILGYCELILDGSMGKVPPGVDEAVAAMMRSGRKVLGILEDFIIGASTDAGMTIPSFRPTDLVDICRSLVDGISPDVSRVNRTLVFEPSVEELEVECDPRLIERVVTNLVDNAVKYSNARGTIRLELRYSGERTAEIRVDDDGIGISPEDLPYVFERYWRGSTVGGIKGSGLGLSIVKQLVEMHGGTINIESVKGSGTTVRVLIPVVQPC